MKEKALRIRDNLAIPISELAFRFSRSGGPGGQHANRSATQVELLFDVASSPSLSESQRQRLLQTLASRLDSEGVLHLTSSGSRSQHENRREVMGRFVRLLRKGLRRPKRRIPTRPSAQAKKRRVERKRRQGKRKQDRSRKDWSDY